jgi:hypothetical protein
MPAVRRLCEGRRGEASRQRAGSTPTTGRGGPSCTSTCSMGFNFCAGLCGVINPINPNKPYNPAAPPHDPSHAHAAAGPPAPRAPPPPTAAAAPPAPAWPPAGWVGQRVAYIHWHITAVRAAGAPRDGKRSRVRSVIPLMLLATTGSGPQHPSCGWLRHTLFSAWLSSQFSSI